MVRWLVWGLQVAGWAVRVVAWEFRRGLIWLRWLPVLLALRLPRPARKPALVTLRRVHLAAFWLTGIPFFAWRVWIEVENALVRLGLMPLGVLARMLLTVASLLDGGRRRASYERWDNVGRKR